MVSINWDRVFNLAGSIVVLAGVAMLVTNARGTANVVRSITGGFSSAIRAAKG